MAQYGRCVNIGNCSKADNREILEIMEGSALTCPECTLQMIPAAPLRRRKPWLLFAGIAGGVVALITILLIGTSGDSYTLTINTTPSDATIKLIGIEKPYISGMTLEAKDYQIAVCKSGYACKTVSVHLVKDTVEAVTLDKDLFNLTVHPRPSDAEIKLLHLDKPYSDNMALAPGLYDIEVCKSGYKCQTVSVNLEKDTVREVTLDKVLYALSITTSPADASIKIQGLHEPYSDGMALPPKEYSVIVSKENYLSKTVKINLNKDISKEIKLEKRRIEEKKISPTPKMVPTAPYPTPKQNPLDDPDITAARQRGEKYKQEVLECQRNPNTCK